MATHQFVSFLLAGWDNSLMCDPSSRIRLGELSWTNRLSERVRFGWHYRTRLHPNAPRSDSVRPLIISNQSRRFQRRSYVMCVGQRGDSISHSRETRRPVEWMEPWSKLLTLLAVQLNWLVSLVNAHRLWPSSAWLTCMRWKQPCSWDGDAREDTNLFQESRWLWIHKRGRPNVS